MVITITAPDRLTGRAMLVPPNAGVILDSIVLPWDGQL
jgi:hypothetical protein